MQRFFLPPVLGSDRRPTVEDHTLPARIRTLFIRIALAAPAAKAAKGEAAYSPAGLAATVWHRLCNAYEAGSDWEKRVPRDLEMYELVGSFARPDDLDFSEEMAGRNATAEVLACAGQILGHDVGVHGGDCPICAAAYRGDWEAVLDLTGCPRTLWRDLRLALVAHKKIDPRTATPSKPAVLAKPVSQYDGIF
jgi:hypothetical protein